MPPGRRLKRGDSYFVRTYAPNPTKAQMEGVVQGFSSHLISYTEIHLPNPGESATEGVGLQGDAARELAALRRPVVFVPLRGNRDPDHDAQFVERTIRNSPYRRMYDLAQSLTADQPTAYAAVKNVSQYLQSNYTYSERVPTRPIPLMGLPVPGAARLLFQQFSGTMALMLRMAGIPARAWPRASPRARSTRTPASTGCATSTRTPGSRSGSRGSAGCRSIRPPRARRRSRSRALSPRARRRPTRAK